MKLFIRESCTARIVKYLEGEILSKRLPPLSKLKPIRDLAEEFDVSSTLVLAAFKELEKRRLIYREERRGVFVSPMAMRPKMREIFIFVFGDDPERNSFIRQILSIMSSKEVLGKMNFGLRVVTFADEDMLNHELTHETLKSEIARLTPSLHADAVLLVGPQFQRDDVELCLTLPAKKLFLGNFKAGDFDDLEYNRLGFAPADFENFIESAALEKAKRVAAITPEELKNASYAVDALNRAEHLAEKYGIALKTVYQADFSSGNPDAVEKGRRCAVKEALEFKPDAIMLDCVRYIDFQPAFREFHLEESRITLYFSGEILHETSVFPSNVRMIVRPQHDLEKMNIRLNELLEQLCEGTLVNDRNDFIANEKEEK